MEWITEWSHGSSQWLCKTTGNISLLMKNKYKKVKTKYLKMLPQNNTICYNPLSDIPSIRYSSLVKGRQIKKYFMDVDRSCISLLLGASILLILLRAQAIRKAKKQA